MQYDVCHAAYDRVNNFEQEMFKPKKCFTLRGAWSVVIFNNGANNLFNSLFLYISRVNSVSEW